MPLQDQLDQMAAQSRQKIPADALEIMDRAIETLRGQISTTSPIAQGAALPPFSLPDASGTAHHLAELHSPQWLAISFYRGRW